MSFGARRTWLQFGICPMLIVFTVVCTVLGIQLGRIRAKARAVDLIQTLGGTVVYDYQWSASKAWIPDAIPPGPHWVRNILGDNYRANVVEVQLFAGPGHSPEKLGDEDVRLLRALSEIRWLVLMDTNITDAGLESLKGLSHLERLDLEGSAVTEKGVEALRKSLPNAKVFY